MPLGPGTQLGSYRILDLIGVGGMGEVYRAEDTRLSRVVAIKVISAHLASQAQFQERFDREALTISQLNHPNVCTLYDVGHQDGADFLVMEFVDGNTLAERLARERLSVTESLDIALQMARGLAHAHRHGIVHRDIKPANVMFADDGLVKLVDFGVAKSKQPGTVTETGVAVGTLAYMAPEQLLPGDGVGPSTDVWGLGVVLFEMLTGERPFNGRDVGSLLRSILHDGVPTMRIGGSARTELGKLVRRALDKQPGERPSAAEIGEQLAACRAEVSTAAQPVSIAAGRGRWWIGVGALALVVAALVGAREFTASRRATWARDEALPQIELLVEADRYVAAFDLATDAEAVLGAGHPSLIRLWTALSVPAAFVTDPAGAAVAVKEYSGAQDDWRPLGITPLHTRVPRGALRFRIEKPGFDPVHLARTLTAAFEPPPIPLSPAGSAANLVTVPGDRLPVNLSGFNTEDLIDLPPFSIDRTEVTNRAYKSFIDAGGYDNPAWWRAGSGQPSAFVDVTGRRGPSTWEAGDFLAGRGDDPVGGVSWYEAAAYCASRGAALPTVYHWARAALAPREVTAPLGPSIVPLSNFNTQGPAPVASYAGMGPYGTYDMAGNIREWTWNETASARRLVLGGSWNDPDYMFSVPFSLPPADRSVFNGFRCMHVSEPVAETLAAAVDVSASDYRDARPVSDEVFALFAKQFAYVPSTDGAAAVEARVQTPGDTIREQVTIDVGYGAERMRLFVFLPIAGTPPYEAVVYFPALNAFQSKTSSASFYPAEYVVKSGRALVLPVFKGSFERWDPTLGLTGEEYLRALRVRLTEWRQDLGRSIDYLETRADIKPGGVVYYGRSFGASMPLALLALEPRVTLAIFYSGGFTYRRLPAETDAVNYVSRVSIPVLMLNGRHDYVLPFETSQKPLFNLLGTPAADKRHVVYDAGHDPLPRTKFVKEILAWLDRYGK